MLTDWNERKHIISTAFRNAPELPADYDPAAYQELLATLPIHGQRDYAILVAIVRDAIMQARREGRQTKLLEGFLQWVERYRSRITPS